MAHPVTKQPMEFDQLTAVVVDRLSKNLRIRRNLPGGGRLRIDRQLPFLCVYRQPPGRSDVGTRQLVTTEASYLFASGEARHQGGLEMLVGGIASVLTEHFGAFLLLEIWASEDPPPTSAVQRRPVFRIHSADAASLPGTVEAIAEGLRQVAVQGRKAEVQTTDTEAAGPPGLDPLRSMCGDGLEACFFVGLEVSPVYRDAETLFPVLLHQLRRGVSVAVRKGVFAFAGIRGQPREKHFDAFGPSTMVRAARDVDQQLCDVSDAFDFLLQVTPVNAESAWHAFTQSGQDAEPELHYRHLPYQPNLLKRRLFEVPIERIEDPTLSHLFWEKQNELDLQLTALRELETPAFLHCSRQLYGSADATLLTLAGELLERLPCPQAPSSCPEAEEDRQVVPTSQVVARAREEFDHYRQQLPQFTATLELSDSIASGIMVSRGKLIISQNLQLNAARLEPLLHHEIGTHLLTYFNGLCQPFRQLSSGLAKYESLQEGLAVLAEYLTGGLSAARLRMLAARVIAVHAMDSGAAFLDTYRLLTRQHGIASRAAFTTTLRAFRGGGLTKDCIYLRGLSQLLDFLRGGHDLEPLYVGKIALAHLPYMQELRRRGIVLAPKVLPRFWAEPQLRSRLEACRGLSVLDLAGQV